MQNPEVLEQGGDDQPDLSDLILSSFQQVSTFGLKVPFLVNEEEVQVTYVPTLSAYRIGFDDGDNNIVEKEYGSQKKPFDRLTFVEDFEANTKKRTIKSGWISILFTKTKVQSFMDSDNQQS